MKRLLLLLFIAAIIGSCDYPTRNEYNSLKLELELCKKENENLMVPPGKKLYGADSLFDTKNYQLAKITYQDLISRFPGTEEAKLSEQKLAQINDLEHQQDVKAGKVPDFKGKENSLNVTVGDCSMVFSNVGLNKKLIVDRYGDQYHIYTAERDQTLLTADVTITSQSKDPKLPPVLLYVRTGNSLKYVGVLDYHFYRWEDYSTYLGNYSDHGNDFSYTKTIKFSCGLRIDNILLKEKMYLLVKNENVVERDYNRYSNPPVSYSPPLSFKPEAEIPLDQLLYKYHQIKTFQ